MCSFCNTFKIHHLRWRCIHQKYFFTILLRRYVYGLTDKKYDDRNMKDKVVMKHQNKKGKKSKRSEKVKGFVMDRICSNENRWARKFSGLLI